MLRISKQTLEQDPLKIWLASWGILYLEATLHISSWILDRPVLLTSRLCVHRPEKSLTASFLAAWDDLGDEESLWVTVVRPMPKPLTLQKHLVHLVGLTIRQRDMEQRIFRVDILYASLPKRVAIRRYGTQYSHQAAD